MPEKAATPSDPTLLDRERSPLHPHPSGGPLPIPAVTAGMARGDEEAFNRFYGEYFDRIHRYLLVVTSGDEELSREVLQEAMVKVIRYIRPLPDETALCRWLRRVVRSALVDETRRRRVRRALPLEAGPEPDASEPEDPDALLLERLHRGLARLPRDEADLVRAKHLEGRSYRELAAAQGLTERAVESRLVRIRRKLREFALRGIDHEA